MNAVADEEAVKYEIIESIYLQEYGVEGIVEKFEASISSEKLRHGRVGDSFGVTRAPTVFFLTTHRA